MDKVNAEVTHVIAVSTLIKHDTIIFIYVWKTKIIPATIIAKWNSSLKSPVEIVRVNIQTIIIASNKMIEAHPGTQSYASKPMLPVYQIMGVSK